LLPLSRLRRVVCFTGSGFRQTISNFAILHSSRFDRDTTAHRSTLPSKAIEMPSVGLSDLGLGGRGFEWPLRSKMRNSQKVLALARHLQKNKHRHWAKESSLDCRPGDFCRNRDARKLLNYSEEPTFLNRGSCNNRSASTLSEPNPHAFFGKARALLTVVEQRGRTE
jgi:hypothetical protein